MDSLFSGDGGLLDGGGGGDWWGNIREQLISTAVHTFLSLLLICAPTRLNKNETTLTEDLLMKMTQYRWKHFEFLCCHLFCTI